ncbi:MAG: hypothetical protein PHQ23_04105 [Candidatus Wallbacteria bacterium]|nr:hypothetical protein [Candidatus Wallbacteria bacterium]
MVKFFRIADKAIRPACQIIYYTVCGFLILEALFQFAALFAVNRSTDHNAALRDTVLCVGDSYTYGAGVASDQSYPSQLRIMLNAQKMDAINCGVPSANSAVILERLQENRRDSAEVFLNLGLTHYHSGDHSTARDFFDQGIHADPDFAANYHFLGDMEWDYGSRERGLYLMEKAIDLDPSNFRYRYGLGYRLDDSPDRALELLLQACALNPWDRNVNQCIGYYSAKLGRYQEAAEFYQFIGDMDSVDAMHLADRHGNMARIVLDSVTGKWLDRDLRAIVRTCRQYGSEVILMNYPIYDNSVVMNLARKHGIKFVDIYQAFRGLQDQSGMLLNDLHCSAQGNLLTARLVCQEVLKLTENSACVTQNSGFN